MRTEESYLKEEGDRQEEVGDGRWDWERRNNKSSYCCPTCGFCLISLWGVVPFHMCVVFLSCVVLKSVILNILV